VRLGQSAQRGLVFVMFVPRPHLCSTLAQMGLARPVADYLDSAARGLGTTWVSTSGASSLHRIAA
jgi:hypothetical protein